MTPGLRAVVIDADADDREYTLALCRRLGIIVNGWADSAAAGLELIESLPAPPDLAIIDLHLPDMDGADLILTLSMLERDISIAICSRACARLQDAALTLAVTLGLPPLGAIPKPLQPQALQAAVQACVPAAARAHMPLRPAPAPDAAPPPDGERLLAALTAHQFELHYQPKIALRNGTLQGVEALVRWRHPLHGLLMPNAFLPHTEAAGLIDLLTMEVVNLALADWRGWNAIGLTLPLAINLSPLSLSDPHLAGQLIAATAAAGVPPEHITFEITEQAEIADLATALRILIKLRLHGFGLSLDDYGAGHASLLQLSRFPFNELKLDRRLVHRAAERPHMRPLLRNTIAAARELKVVTVAEGIETQQDRRLMLELGCDLAQGYLVGRPMPAAALPSWSAGNAAAASEAGGEFTGKGKVVQLRPSL
ncbi:EAL domain-containing response regulator [Duganella aceris]|uniref:EAL domain-containing response regulator n=1 Tax=Duganella aceris TaxID=2703883 RepID=A0ABX0FGI4_9BURK|nr:EAL domain-containing response regulator [Duganella aceris]NGZ83672.1 EAL domain-containing response regulator [Duganella aceris]